MAIVLDDSCTKNTDLHHRSSPFCDHWHASLHNVFVRYAVQGIPMRTVELFCGAGGMSHGLIEAGFEIVRAYDAWPIAVENYRRNIGPHAEVGDLKNLLSIIPEISRLAPDLICGGPPCQDYSSAGLREEGENASLTIAFAIAVTTVRPEWFIMENVTQIAKSEAWTEARAMLVRAGYGLTETKINAAHHGAPQARKRLFVVGRIGEKDGFLESAISEAASEKPMTLRDVFGQSVPNALFFPARMPNKRCIWSVDEPAPTIRSSSNRSIPAGYRPHPDDTALIENGFVYCRPLRAGRGVRSIDEPMHTITRTSWERPTSRYLSQPHKDDPVPATKAAVLTPHQLSRIQGFPIDWNWSAGTKQDIMQMIANAVPPPVARSIGSVILARQRGMTVPEDGGDFLDWLVRGERTRATARNVKFRLGRARRLLNGKTFVDVAVEIAALEATPEFQALPKGTRSDLRQALRLHAEFLAAKNSKSKKPKTRKPSINLDESDARNDGNMNTTNEPEFAKAS